VRENIIMSIIEKDLSSDLYINFQKILRSLNFGRGLTKAPSITGTQMRILSLFNENDIVVEGLKGDLGDKFFGLSNPIAGISLLS